MKFSSLFVIVSLLTTSIFPEAQAGVAQKLGKEKPATEKSDSKIPPPGGVNVLEGDFLTGFETGIFLRKDKTQLDEYGCPKAEIKMDEFKKIRDLLPNVKNIIGVMTGGAGNDHELDNMLDSLVVFVNHLDELIGVFDSEYNGGDFCAGMTFGASGSNLLFSIAETIVSHAIKSIQKPKGMQDDGTILGQEDEEKDEEKPTIVN